MSLPSSHFFTSSVVLPVHLLLNLWVTLAAAANPVVCNISFHTQHGFLNAKLVLLLVQGRRSQSYEPLLLENEREAVADLLQYLESTGFPLTQVAALLTTLSSDRTTTNFFTGSPLSALTTLSFSDNVDLQRSAALAFAEITEKEVRPVARDTLDPILFLLSSHDSEVQRAASAALGNLAVNSKLFYSYVYLLKLNRLAWLADNKLLIVKLGGLEPLIRQMLSPNVEVQCNAVGCVTNLATHGRFRP